MSSPDLDSQNRATPSASTGNLLTVAVALVVGLALVFFSVRDSYFSGLFDAQIVIRLNGLDERIGRDILFPSHGFVLEIELPEALPKSVLETLRVSLREERTGASIEIADRLAGSGALRWLVVPESLGLHAGLFSISVHLTDADARELVAHRRLRVRTWLGGPPIGSRQIIHFDFSVDRDEDGRPDFEQDLERMGLAVPADPTLAAKIARRVAERAIARVHRAYDPTDDPNGTRRELDTVYVRFLLETEPSPFVTRICVGGANAAHPGSIGNVQYDHHNALKGGSECEGEASAGLFPAEFSIYSGNALYREILSPFAATENGEAFGARGDDASALEGGASGARAGQIARAINVIGDALGTVMAHEAAHALGLVPAGRPGVGLFGGSEEDGSGYAHNLDVLRYLEGEGPKQAWLMNDGRTFRFDDLAGVGPAGELRFRPLNHAYLKDRVVLIDGRRNR